MGFILSFSPSQPFRRIDSRHRQLAYVEGGGLVRVLFGLPFLALGLFLVAMIGRFAANLWADPPAASEWFLIGAGFAILLGNCAMFTAFGGWLVFGRSGVVFDTQGKTVTLWYSLPFVRRSMRYNFGVYRAVSVILSGVSFRTGPTYSLLLCGGEAAPLVVANLSVPRAKADLLAYEIADFLEWNVIESGCEENERDAKGDSVRPART